MESIGGNHIISDEVIATIALSAAQEVKGINTPGSFADKLGKRQSIKGIKVEQQEEGLKLEVKAVVDYGLNIPQVCNEFREKVIEKLGNLTGLDVLAVDIHVTGINIHTDHIQET